MRQRVVGEFNLDRKDSALSRLVALVEFAQKNLTSELSLDNEDSAPPWLAASLARNRTSAPCLLSRLNWPRIRYHAPTSWLSPARSSISTSWLFSPINQDACGGRRDRGQGRPADYRARAPEDRRRLAHLRHADEYKAFLPHHDNLSAQIHASAFRIYAINQATGLGSTDTFEVGASCGRDSTVAGGTSVEECWSPLAAVEGSVPPTRTSVLAGRPHSNCFEHLPRTMIGNALFRRWRRGLRALGNRSGRRLSRRGRGLGRLRFAMMFNRAPCSRTDYSMPTGYMASNASDSSAF